LLAFSTQVRGFKPGRSRRIFQGGKILSKVKPSVPCRRFTACKRFLNVTWKSGISGKIRRPFLAHIVPPLAARNYGRRLVVKVGTSKIRLIRTHNYSSTSGCEDLLRRLAVRVGTSKGSTISQRGCSTSGALATGALQKEEEGLVALGP
jgi:hypothetical protein